MDLPCVARRALFPIGEPETLHVSATSLRVRSSSDGGRFAQMNGTR